MRKKVADARKAERQSGRARVHLPKFSRLYKPGNAWPGLPFGHPGMTAVAMAPRHSHGREGSVRRWRWFDFDRIAWPYFAAGYDDGHDAGLADQVAVLVAPERCRHQPDLDAVQLCAGITQPGYLDNCRRAQMQPCAGRQSQQIDAVGRDVLAHLPGCDGEAGFPQFVMQLGMDQMHLPHIGLGGVARHPRAVFDGRTEMRVAFDPEADQ
jgi:hypothetical protein